MKRSNVTKGLMVSLNYSVLLLIVWANQFAFGKKCCNICNSDGWNAQTKLIQIRLKASGIKLKSVACQL